MAEITLLDWGARGSARADLEGREIAVNRGIPGERVEATIERRRGPWRGMVERVLTPSPLRVPAPCPYFHAGCGGCQWQHLSYEGQLEAKEELANRELTAAGLAARVQAVHGMEQPWRYRRTAAIALGWEAGFRPLGRRGIIEVGDCLIAHPLIGRLASNLNRALRSGLLPNYHGKIWLDCTVVDGAHGPAVQAVIQGIAGLTLEDHPELPEVAAVLAGIEDIASVAYRHRSGAVQTLEGPLCGRIVVAGVPMLVPAGAFFQANVSMLEHLLERLHHVLAGMQIGHAADIYGGVGTFAFALARHCRQITLIELDAQAVDAARRTAAETGLTNVRCVPSHAERALLDVGALDLAIVDPPRSGLGEPVVQLLGDHGPPLLFYVSCGPPSLARDLAGLIESGYEVQSLELFDFYPQTFHVEALAVLTR
jgi:23S rRNA (uracil1939-C5)-methyltransferase